MARRQYTDAEKLKYWRERALKGAGNAQTRSQNYTQNRPQYKKSGAIFSKITKGKYEGLMAVNAWKKTKYGMIKANAIPLSNSSSESANGNQYVPYLVTVIDMNSLQSSKYNGIMNIQTRILTITDLGMCITPNGSGTTKSGTKVRGYFGKFTK